MMDYRELYPAAEFGRFVRCFWQLEHDGVDAGIERVVPDGCPEIVFNLADPFEQFAETGRRKQPLSIIVGQMSRAVTIRPTGRVRLFGVRFQPYGLAGVFDDAASTISDRIESVADVFGGATRELEERIFLAVDFESRRMVFESWLRRRMRMRAESAQFAVVAAAADAIERSNGGLRIGDVSKFVNANQRSLERAFGRVLGISPKAFARIVRIQTVLKSIGGEPAWADLAVAGGFFDQAHFIRDFRALTGVCPSEFYRESNQMAEYFSGPESPVVDLLQ